MYSAFPFSKAFLVKVILEVCLTLPNMYGQVTKLANVLWNYEEFLYVRPLDMVAVILVEMSIYLELTNINFMYSQWNSLLFKMSAIV
jgi:hypothetical protein